MIPVVLIRKTYNSFLDEKKSEGVCFGLCLTWLGDILKERPAQKMGNWFPGWLSGWFSPPLTADKKALIPSDTVKLRLLLERAYRRHESYLKSCRESQQDPKRQTGRHEAFVNYKNFRQAEKEKITGVPGLQYRLIARNDFMLFNGLNLSGHAHPLTGTIIAFRYSEIPGEVGYHSVAAFRYNATECFFLDPNLGLFKTSSSYPMKDVTQYINKVYKEAVPLLEFIVSRNN